MRLSKVDAIRPLARRGTLRRHRGLHERRARRRAHGRRWCGRRRLRRVDRRRCLRSQRLEGLFDEVAIRLNWSLACDWADFAALEHVAVSALHLTERQIGKRLHVLLLLGMLLLRLLRLLLLLRRRSLLKRQRWSEALQRRRLRLGRCC